jgi:hypothetical protein
MHFIEKKVGAKVLKDYSGMNVMAAHSMGFPWHYKRNVVLVDKTASPHEQHEIMVHEMAEETYMEKGDSYWQAHQKSMNKYWR